MSRRAPAVDRTVALMSFLAAHPGRSFSLSELARELTINKATAHSMLSTLADSGWVLRDAAKRYRLGPGIVAIAKAAMDRYQLAVNVAASHMRALADEFGLHCVMTGLVGDEMEVLAVEAPAAPTRVSFEAGLRVPFELALGSLFLAWSDEDTIEQFLRAAQYTSEEFAGRCRETLARVRRCGYALMPTNSVRQRMTELLRELSDGPSRPRARQALQLILADLEREEMDLVVTDIRPGQRYEGGFLGAPVFDGDGQVLATFGLADFSAAVDGAAMLARAGRVAGVAAEITRAIDGRPPPVRSYRTLERS